ncbi:hypothetical protein [Cellulomonas palmilytica]|uniref:hypothetical protein n=1 Tax=Cellulomonas palmilytica TaxID=2608402 RepID=UPI001F2E7A4F|nr:hypothetical protein [Cellulomonas palmilytica]UJP40443.1 hypothetical protein F1D97_02625 [Cellulomonas palmilytica]
MQLPPLSRVPALVAVGGLLAGGFTGALAGGALADEGGPRPLPRVAVRYDTAHVITDLAQALAATDTYTFELRVDPQAPVVAGAAEREGDGWDLVGRIDEDGATSELRLVDDDAYASLPGLTDGFARTSRTDPADPLVGAYVDYLAVVDLGSRFADIRDAVASVAPGGASITVDDVAAQPFDVVVDLRRATGATGERYTSGAVSNPYWMLRLWIGPDGLVRRYAEPAGTVEADLTGWNTDVDIDPPDDFTELDPRA